MQEREFLRRSTLASWLILGVLVTVVIISPIGASDARSATAVGVVALVAIVAAFLNRYGHVSLAALLLTGVIFLAPLYSITPEAGTPGGAIDVDVLPAYDLLVLSVLSAASLFAPVAGFWMAGLDFVAIVLDYVLQPHTSYLQVNYGGVLGTCEILARPIGLLVLAAVVAHLWVRGVQSASQRADSAEEELAFKQRVATREAQQLEAIKDLLSWFTNALAMASQGRQPPEIVSRHDGLAQVVPFLNDQVRQVYRLKLQRRHDDPVLAAATNHLLVTLQQLADAEPGRGMWRATLDPQRFHTQVPVIDSIAFAINTLLFNELTYAYTSLRQQAAYVHHSEQR